MRFHNDMKGLVITENIANTAHQPWGSELAEAQRKIKARYIYNRVHDADSIINMMSFLAEADEQRNCQEVTAPENNEAANMVAMGIDWLQQFFQKLPSDYASTDRDKESALASTDSESSAETRYQTRGSKKDRKGRRQQHRIRTPSTSPSRSPPRHRSRSRPRRSSSRKPDKRDINPTRFPHCKEYRAYGLAHAAPKNVQHDKCNYNKKWKGWRPEWVCKKIGITYKDHEECKE